jgi:hypothetical protein
MTGVGPGGYRPVAAQLQGPSRVRPPWAVPHPTLTPTRCVKHRAGWRAAPDTEVLGAATRRPLVPVAVAVYPWELRIPPSLRGLGT